MSFHTSRWIKRTRKPHSCTWCGKNIPVNGPAHCGSGVGPDGFYYGYEHPECRAAIDAMPYEDLQNGWDFGEFARGRTDDNTDAPPMFSSDYRGRV